MKKITDVDQKIRIGDWKFDTIIGKNHKGALVSAVERVSKFTQYQAPKVFQFSNPSGGFYPCFSKFCT